LIQAQRSLASTPKGRALDKLDDFHETINERLPVGFSAKETAVLFALLERIEENAGNGDS